MKQILSTDKKPYKIIITDNYDNLVSEIKQVIKPSCIAIITDTHVEKIYLGEIQNKLQQISPVTTFVFEAGEHAKHIETVKAAYNQLVEEGFDRSGLIVALGGGVVGDLAGFVASSYMRGVPFIQIPTTIVSQNDSSIGGKVGVDYLAHKNMIGAFYNPLLIYMNVTTIQTLPEKEFFGGMSEVIKHGIIRDPSLYEYLKTHKEVIIAQNIEALIEMTYLSCLVKCQVVEEDHKELGIRKILNYGHTIGHAIETLSHFSLNHGECVAFGMVMATYISFIRGYIKESTLETLETLCRDYHLLEAFPVVELEAVVEQMMHDKKKLHGKINFILLEEVGQCKIVNDVQVEEINKALVYIRKRAI